MPQKPFRHRLAKAEPIITPYGTAQFDEAGRLTNRQDLDCTDDQLVAVPDFIDASVYEGADAVVEPEIAVQPIHREMAKADKPSGLKDVSDEELRVIIRTLVEEGAATNSEGYIEMGALLRALKSAGYRPVTGERRKAVQGVPTR